MTSVTVQQLLDPKQATPDAANNRRKTLLAMFRWAIPRGLAAENPVEKTQKIKVHSEGHAAWSQEHVTRFVETHPLTCPLALHRAAGWRRDPLRPSARQGRQAPVRSAEERAEVA
jgi:hypothetical protein